MKTEHMMIAGLAGYMMMKKGNSGLGGLGQAQSTEQAPTGYSVPSTWSEIDFNNSLQTGDSYNKTTFYAHEIHSWYTTKVFTNNPSDMNRDPVWESVGRNMRSDPKLKNMFRREWSDEQFRKLELAMKAGGHFYNWQKKFLVAVTAAMEKELLAKVQPISNQLITTTDYINKVVIPASSVLSNYIPAYVKGHEALIEGTKPVSITYPPIPN